MSKIIPEQPSGGGTQYTDGQSVATPIGNQIMFDNAGVQSSVSNTAPLPVDASVSLAGDPIPVTGVTDAVAVAIVNGSGDQITSFGGGTQYTDGAAEASPTGTVAMGTDGANVFALHTDVSGDLQIDVLSSALPTGAATAARQDTGNTSLATIAGAISGTEMQVDVLTMPTTTVQATNLDIRDLVFASDKVDASGTVLGAGTNNIGDVDIASIAAGDNNIGNVDVVTLPSIPAGTNNIGDVDIASIAAGDNNIGNVDIVTMPNVVIGSGTVTAVTSITNTVNTKEVRSATPAQTSPSVTNVSTSILASNANRLGATIYNEGTATCYMKLGATASTTSYTLQIAQGGYYEVPFGYTGAIDGITSASTAQLRVTELTS